MEHILTLILFLCSMTISAQDIIVTKNGTAIPCYIVKVNEAEVVYKKWEERNNSSHVADREDIIAIHFNQKKSNNRNIEKYDRFIEKNGRFIAPTLNAEYKAITQDDLTQGAAIDMGLSVKWASCNIKANNPSDNGYQYAWGETNPMNSKADWKNYKYCNGTIDSITKYFINQEEGKSLPTLELEDDVAFITMGEKWRIPTYEEMKELMTNCKWEFAELNHEKGCLITAKNGNTIFLPHSVYYNGGGRCNEYSVYWTSTGCDIDGGAYCLLLRMDIGQLEINPSFGRCCGMNIRAVCR